MQNLRSKIAIFGLSISLLTGFVMSIYTLKSNLEYFKRNHEKDARFKLESIIQTIRSNSAKIKSDALFLASTPPIEGILRAKRNNGIDPKDKSSIETWKLRLQKIFEEMLYINSDYMQIRYIGVDDNGREIVRSERFGNKVSSFKEVDLQKKGDRVYFKKTLENFQHKVYFSRITANKELGKVVYPIQMVLRAGVPVFENIKRPFGGVFINANYSSLFKGLDFFQDNRHLLLVKDELGQALISYKNGFKFYHEEGKANLKHEDFFEDSSDHPPIFKQKIHYNDLNPDQYLEISFSLAENQLSGDLKKALFSEFFILLAMLLLVGFISFIISKKFVAPLEELSRLTKKLESETYTESDLVYSKDKSEVGELTNTLIRMTKNVKTSRKQVEDQKKALDSAAIVVETDRFGKITYVNEKFVEISGYTRGELLGKDHRIVNSGYHTKEFFRELWSTIKDGLIWSGEVKNKTKSGDFYWVDTTIYPVLNDFGETEKYIAIRLDITDQKLIQEKYRRSVETKSNFLANMSHEIRTPLNGIIGFSDILVKKDLDGESKTEVEHIKSCSEGLLQIVNDILDISKIER